MATAVEQRSVGRTDESNRPPTFYLIAVLRYGFLILISLVAFLPFILSFLGTFKTNAELTAFPPAFLPQQWQWDNWVRVWNFSLPTLQNAVPRWIWNSLFTAVLITVITVVISALAGYAFSRIDFTGRKVLFAVIIGSIIIPPQILLVPLFRQMLAFGMVDSYAGIVLPQVIAPAMVFILKKFFDAVPLELEEAARVDGANRLRVFLQVVLPLSRPILAAVSIFVFIGAWNNFLWPFIVINDASLMTLPVGLQTVKSAYGIQYAQNMASAILAALPLIIVFLFFQRQIIKGVSTTGLAGQ